MTMKQKRTFSADRRIWMLIGTITVIALLFIPYSQFVLGVNYSYTLRTVALGGAILGVVSGVLGCFAVLRQQSLMGDALSHAALPGVGIAFLLIGRELGALLIGAGIASWLGVLVIGAITRTTRIKQDAAMGIVLAGWFAAGIALLAYIQARPDASQAGLDSFIFGQAAAMVESDVQLISAVGFIAFIIIALFWKEFKLITFDPEFAGANGFRIGILNTLLSTLIVVAIILGLQLAGVILMVGMLIAPGIAARQWTHKLDQMVILSAVFGAFAGGTGAIISAVDSDVPTGPMIIVVAFVLVMISLAIAPERGLLWRWLRERQDRRRFASQTILREIYRYAQAHGGTDTPVPHRFIMGLHRDSARLGLKQLLAERQIMQLPDDDQWYLTAAGMKAAQGQAYNHQLWETYRRYGHELNLPLIKIDYQLNITDLLPKHAIHQLENKLEGEA